MFISEYFGLGDELDKEEIIVVFCSLCQSPFYALLPPLPMLYWNMFQNAK